MSLAENVEKCRDIGKNPEDDNFILNFRKNL